MFTKAFIEYLPSYIDLLQSADLPIFIYGMGDGCLKVLKIFEEYNIPCGGIFASDEFVRDKVFCGHRIHKLSEIEAAVEEFIVVLAFGAGYPELMERLESIASRHRLIVPDMPVFGEGLFTKAYALEHFEELEKVYSLLADDKSRQVFRDVVEFKITGDIACLKRCETPAEEAYAEILKPTAGEIAVDLGAYTGDTIRELLSHTDGRYSHIYAVEPNKRNFRKLSEYAAGMESVTLIHAAAWSCDTTLYFSKSGGRMPHPTSDGIETLAVSVDNVLNGAPCTYIKMDVEGSEREAIAGAAATVSRCGPKLNIALYHRVGDIFELPLLIHDISGEYRLYMRHHPYYPAWDTNLYAIQGGM